MAEVTWHQPHDERFDDPEFYDHDDVVTVTDGDYTITVVRQGEAHLEFDGEEYRTWTHFRVGFPDGELPTDADDGEWHNNGWFALAGAGDAEFDNDPASSLKDALASATGLVREFNIKVFEEYRTQLAEFLDYKHALEVKHNG